MVAAYFQYTRACIRVGVYISALTLPIHIHTRVFSLQLMDLKIFVDTDADVRLARRMLRDMSERGRSLANVMEQYNRFVKSSYDQFIAPCMEYADIIIPRGGQNDVAVNVIVQHVTKQLLLVYYISRINGVVGRRLLTRVFILAIVPPAARQASALPAGPLQPGQGHLRDQVSPHPQAHQADPRLANTDQGLHNAAGPVHLLFRSADETAE